MHSRLITAEPRARSMSSASIPSHSFGEPMTYVGLLIAPSQRVIVPSSPSLSIPSQGDAAGVEVTHCAVHGAAADVDVVEQPPPTAPPRGSARVHTDTDGPT